MSDWSLLKSLLSDLRTEAEAQMTFQATDLLVDLGEESSVHCACCGQVTRCISGFIAKDDVWLAGYWVRWTVDRLENDPTFDLVLGRWGEDTTPEDRYCVSLFYRFSVRSFMVIDAHENQFSDGAIASTGLRRDEVIGTPLAAQVFALVDAIWLQDRRLFSSNAPGREDMCPSCTGAPHEDN